MSTTTVIVPQQSSNASELREAIRDVAQAAREAGQAARAAAKQAAADARTAAADAKTAAEDAKTAAADSRTSAADSRTSAADNQTNARDGGGPARAGNAVIVIPDKGGEDIRINVDGRGIHVQQGDNTTTIPIRDVVPRGAVQMTQAICSAIIALAVVGPLLRFFLRRFERRDVTRGVSTTLSAEVQARLDAMERNIDTVAVELERVSEGQRFTNKLLEQRPMEHAQRIDR